jgi:predicted amidophosphoribosyltransferase
VGLTEDERRKNIRGAFGLKDPSVFKGKRILLVDDVYTTGATVKECSRVLKRAGATVYALTVARAI